MAMDHAEAHERIADLALERDGLDRLRADPAPSDERALVEHVRGCPTCSADLATSHALRDRLQLALADLADGAALDPIGPPDWLRDVVLDAAHREPVAAGPSVAAGAAGPSVAAVPPRPSSWALPRWTAPQWAVGLAAVLAIALLGGLAGAALVRPGGPGLDPSMVAVVATLDRVLAEPDHRAVQLRTPAGTAAGSVAWSSSDIAVLASSLSAPSGDRAYRCWLEWSGRWAPVGAMEFAGGTAYWTGPVGEWADLMADPDARFVVTLEPAGPPRDAPAGAIVLEAGLGS